MKNSSKLKKGVEISFFVPAFMCIGVRSDIITPNFIMFDLFDINAAVRIEQPLIDKAIAFVEDNRKIRNEQISLKDFFINQLYSEFHEKRIVNHLFESLNGHYPSGTIRNDTPPVKCFEQLIVTEEGRLPQFSNDNMYMVFGNFLYELPSKLKKSAMLAFFIEANKHDIFVSAPFLNMGDYKVIKEKGKRTTYGYRTSLFSDLYRKMLNNHPQNTTLIDQTKETK